MSPWAALLHRAASDAEGGDAACFLAVRPPEHCSGGNRLAEKLSSVRQFVKLLNSGGGGHSTGVGDEPTSCKEPGQRTSLQDLPDAAAFLIWQLVRKEARTALLSSSPITRSLFSRCIHHVHLTAADLKRCGVEQLGRLHLLLPQLNHLELQLGNDVDLLLLVKHLKRNTLPHLNSFYMDSKLKDESFHVVARFLVSCPNLKKLLLPNQRCSSTTDQRVLATLLEALPSLTHVDLGQSHCSSSSSSGTSNALTPSVIRRIMRCSSLLSLSCNASAVPDSQLASLAHLRSLRSLSISASGSGQGLAAALQGLTQLTSLEVQHPSIRGELVGCLGGLSQLQVLALGLCPKLTDTITPEVSKLQQLQKLTLPFAISASHLRLLARLPALQELFSWRSIELDVLGPAHEPLHRVTRLVCSTVHGRGKSLAAWFPALEVLCMKHCSEMAALSLRGCVGLQVLMMGEAGQLSDEGFACLRELRGLQRLQLEGASLLSDAAFSAVFSSTMPALHQLKLAGCSGVSDVGLQALTASCRRLANISISSCRQLTDKTLKRLARCEHLSTVTLKSCRGFTAQGVAALAAAPHMKAVLVNGCVGVRGSLCKGYRPGVKVRVEDRL